MSNHEQTVTFAAPSSRTLSDYVVDQLRQAILTDQLKPGERIVEREIAEAMETSRGPVRDALRQLENEGLVVRQAHRGTFVARLTREDAQEIYTLRVALESLAVEFVIERASSQEINRLERLVDRMQHQAQDGSTQAEAAELDLEFHHTLVEISGHRRLLAAWEALAPQIRLLLLSYRYNFPDDWDAVGVKNHRQVVKLLRGPDVALARSILRDHLMASFETIVQAFD
jgi:DNA-binding GntR family transcriptional regulator